MKTAVEEEAGVWYVYDKGRDDPVVYKVRAPTRDAAFNAVQKKLRRPHGDGLRVGPWSQWAAGPEPVIPLTAKATARKSRRRKA